ncbi:hypothetical protein Srot_2356 [Segniliparus rotundus DSM 44985]|uniref:Uncharacterized protein n=1 Tax=Segniliparus rotundus (strain ATCC BAA-972 / CDC 1076 / CIP 108378 / DSM 44985 / JCM 13578) TaxID=640132 RepID=D6ZAR8_SEGRD|nr:hypothetical protein [Segniliparus rotundus]ADG98804.1 hypothetical protein Srot_2356 [Segniliparus rotundus DSM 44985]
MKNLHRLELSLNVKTGLGKVRLDGHELLVPADSDITIATGPGEAARLTLTILAEHTSLRFTDQH